MTRPNPTSFLDLFAGGGEMGARMQVMEWSRTPVGAVEHWPQSLKVVLRIMLTSRYAMWLGWGTDFTFFCNDAYLPTLGTKHAWALGASARRVWAEIWNDIGPRAEAVLTTGVATWDEGLLLFLERRGFAEETYHTFSYSPVPDDTGGVGGMLCVVTEDTERTIGERRLRTLRELSAGTIAARTASDACRRAAAALAGNALDLPFVLLYQLDERGENAVLVAQAGLSAGSPAAPLSIALDARSDPRHGWPFAEVQRTRTAVTVSDVARRSGPLQAGPWPDPIQAATVLPLTAAGQDERLTGFFVAGLSPRRPLDDDYRGFLELLVGQIASAISDARTYEEERRHAEQLAELDRAKTAFFSNVSHEFRTPLTLMMGPIEDALATNSPSLSGPILETVHRNAVRLLKLVNALLDFSRIEAGRAQASYVPTDLAQLTTDLASAFRAAIERAGLIFEVDCRALDLPVYVDRDMWEKIVLNLLSNALKFTFAGSIRVGLRPQGDTIELTVEDTGTGIPAVELPHLFERFHRVQGARARTHEGSGIGLALVNELARLHGGGVRVASVVGEGTSFTVSIRKGSGHLPVERLAPSPSQSPVGTGAAPFVEEALRWLPDRDDTPPPDRPREQSPFMTELQGSYPAGPAHILLVDDNADMRDYVGRLLRQRWTVQTASDGIAALAAVRRRRPDLVLTDAMMPNLDGFGLLRALRADPATKDLPVVLLSARAGEESRAGGLEAGADDYLAKPFSARELLARVSAHLQIARLREAAENERRKLQEILLQAPVAVAVLLGPEHRYIVANPPYCALVGRADLMGKTVREAFPEIGDPEITGILGRVFETGETVEVKESSIPGWRGAERSGEAYFNSVAQPLREEGAVVGVVLVANEVTEQVMARRRGEALRAAAEQASRAKDEFIAMLGHELRNPLAPILTALHLMKLRIGNVAERERTVIERQVNHLTRLVDDLLDVSRITRGMVQLDRHAVELGEVVAKAIEMASPVLEQRRHHLEITVPPRGLNVHADLMRLAQVVANLLTNAAKYTDPGGRIEIRGARDGEDVVLEVRDNGIGIAPEMLPHVFDTFVQERQALDRSQGGLGLGLAIVKSLVALHGGAASARSGGNGQGSVFTIRLPALRSDELASAPREIAPSAGHHLRRRHPGLKILVVDDNIEAAELMAEMLNLLGHQTRVAFDSPRALQELREFIPDVALLDIGLPVMDGYELARRLREDPRLRALKLIALTGYGQTSDVHRSQEAGFHLHLVKPVALEALDAILVSIHGDG